MTHTTKLIFLCLAVALYTGVFISCNNKVATNTTQETSIINPEDTSKRDDQLIMALLYQQRAAEYHALCLQSYNTAIQQLNKELSDGNNYTKLYKPFAVVTDLDETALDNSQNEAWLYQQDSAYNPKEFDEWSIYGKADSVPGSVSFFKYVNSLKDKKGNKIDIFYISNRTDSAPVVSSAKNQMQQLGFPQLIDSQFLFKPSNASSSKQARRNKVLDHHNIILLLGDNLADLDSTFDKTASIPEERIKRVDNLRNLFGSKYIVFPNPEYGDWEAALYPNGRYTTLSDEKKQRLLQLKAYHWPSK